MGSAQSVDQSYNPSFDERMGMEEPPVSVFAFSPLSHLQSM